MSNGRANQIAIKHHWLSHFKRYYIDRDYSKEDLIEERDNMSNQDNSMNSAKARERELRIQAISELLDRYE